MISCSSPVMSSSVITKHTFFHWVIILQVGGFGFATGVLYHNIRLTPLHSNLCGREIQKGISNVIQEGSKLQNSGKWLSTLGNVLLLPP